jgi:hypothetical protein
MEAGRMATPPGATFVQALADRDHAQMTSLLHPEVDFEGMTPGRCWQANTATQVVDEILRSWFDDRDRIDYETSNGSITWMRVLCWGFRPVTDGGIG